MSNTSATGGIMIPTLLTLDDLAFRRLVTEHVKAFGQVDIVRPTWQPNPPKLPDIDVDWIALAITNITPDANVYQTLFVDPSTGAAGYIQSRHQDETFGLIFYGANCLTVATKVREAFEINQNIDALIEAGIGFVEFGDIVPAPVLQGEQWYSRCDASLRLRRKIETAFSVLPLDGSEGFIRANRAETTLTRPWVV